MYSGYGSHHGFGESQRKKPKTSWGDTGMRSSTQHSSGFRPSDTLSSLTSNPGFAAWKHTQQHSVYDYGSQLSDISTYGSAGFGVDQGGGLSWERSRYEDRSSHSGAEGSSFSRYGSGRGRGLRPGLGQTRSYQQGPSSLRKQTDTSGRSVVPERQETDESTDLALTVAAEIQRRKKVKLDVGKILKVMQMVGQMEDTETDKSTEYVGYDEERAAESNQGSGVFNHGCGSLGMRAPSARQRGLDIHRASMGRMDEEYTLDMSEQGHNPGMTGNSGMDMMEWGYGTDVMGQVSGNMDMMEGGHGTGVNRIGHELNMHPVTYSYDTNVMAQYPGLNVAGSKSGNRYGPREYKQLPERPSNRDRETYFEDYQRMHWPGPRPPPRMHQLQEQPKPTNRKISGPDHTRKPVVDKRNFSKLSYPSGETQEGQLFWKMSRLVDFIKTEDLTKNPINVIDCAVDRCKVGFTKDFKFEPFLGPENKLLISGRLFLGKVFLARVNGTTRRKEVKNECYAKALKVLTTLPVGAILKRQDPKTTVVGLQTPAAKQKEASAREQTAASAEKKKMALAEEKKMAENSSDDKSQSKLEVLLDHVKALETEEADLVTSLNEAFEQCGVDHCYTEEESKCASGIPWFIGKLKMDDTLIGAGSGPSKKRAMKNSYRKALIFLKKNPLHFRVIKRGAIFNELDLQPQFEIVSERHQRLPNKDTEKKLTNMMQKVLYIPERGSVQDGINNAAKQAKLVLMCLYKEGYRDESEKRNASVCELYLDNIFISMGEDLMPNKAQLQAYQDTFTVLSSSSSDVIFHDFKRLSPEDSVGVREISELWATEQIRTTFCSEGYRGKRKMTNFPKLEGAGSEILLDKDDMIIMESSRWSNDRYNMAYDILQSSAVMNLMVLQVKRTHLKNGFKCQLFLQYEKVAEGFGQSKNSAATRAAADILFRMYQTQTTIKMGNHEENKQRMTYKMVMVKADKLKKETGDTGRDDYFYIPRKINFKTGAVERDEGIMEEEERPKEGKQMPVNRWLKKVTEDMFEKFSKKENLEELVFTGGFPFGDLIQLRMTAKSLNLRTSVKKLPNDVGCQIVVHHKYLASKMLDILKQNGGSSGRYSIISKEELPNPSQLGQYLEPEPSRSQGNKGYGKKRKFPYFYIS